MTQVGVWIVRDGREEDDAGQLEGVGEIDSKVESRIVKSTLGALHPVDNAAVATGGVAGPANGYTIAVAVENCLDRRHFQGMRPERRGSKENNYFRRKKTGGRLLALNAN